ncbi:MAG: hypothetical protein ACI8RZ_004282 [Myxococcota bacterium]|jgi:hypothetical protein
MTGSDFDLLSVDSRWEADLANRRVLSMDPHARVAIKRDVHELVISADARHFADAFHQTMRVPGSQFGLLQVRRPSDRAGQPYQLGDRFQGRFNLPAAVRRLSKGRLLGGPLDRVASSRLGQRQLHRIGDSNASDYGMIDLLELDGQAGDPQARFRFRYRYLEGSPIAGSSTFTIQALPDGNCRLTQVFEYQELDVMTATFFAVFGLKLHNQVVYSQADTSAQQLGARVIETDIPAAYI